MSVQQEIPFVECQDYSGNCNCPQIFASEKSDRHSLDKEIRDCKCNGTCEHENHHFLPKRLCKCKKIFCEIPAHYQLCRCRVACKIVLNKPTYHPADKSVVSVVNKTCIKAHCFNRRDTQIGINYRQIVIKDEKFLKIFQETLGGRQEVTEAHLGSICICLKHFRSQDIRFFWRHGYLHPSAEITVITKPSVEKGIPSKEHLEKVGAQRRHKETFIKMQVSRIALEPNTLSALLDHIEKLESKLSQVDNQDEEPFDFEDEHIKLETTETVEEFYFKFTEANIKLEIAKFNSDTEIFLEISHATSADEVRKIFQDKKQTILKARRIYFIFEYFSGNNIKTCGLYQWHFKESRLYALLPCPLPLNREDFHNQHKTFLISLLQSAHLLQIPRCIESTEQYERPWTPNQLDEPDSYMYVHYFVNKRLNEQSFNIEAPFDYHEFQAFKENYFLTN